MPAIAHADAYAARYTAVALAMQDTCLDYIAGRVADGSRLAQQGFALSRKTRKKMVYQAKAGLPDAVFDTVYGFTLFQGKSGNRSCSVGVVRTNYDTARSVYGAMQSDLRKRGKPIGGAPKGGSFTYTRFQIGAQPIQVKALFGNNALSMEYYIPSR